jgi:hypothetical protein
MAFVWLDLTMNQPPFHEKPTPKESAKGFYRFP